MTKRKNIGHINQNICGQVLKRDSSSSSSSVFSLNRDTELKYLKKEDHISVFGVDEAGNYH